MCSMFAASAPPSKLAYKKLILGVLASPSNDSHRPKLWCLSCTQGTSTAPKNCVFGTCKTPCTEIWKFFMLVTTGTPIHIYCSKKWSKSMQDKWPKSRVVQKNFCAIIKDAILGCYPWGGAKFLCDTRLFFLTYILRFVQIGFSFGPLGCFSLKPFHELPK